MTTRLPFSASVRPRPRANGTTAPREDAMTQESHEWSETSTGVRYRVVREPVGEVFQIDNGGRLKIVQDSAARGGMWYVIRDDGMVLTRSETLGVVEETVRTAGKHWDRGQALAD